MSSIQKKFGRWRIFMKGIKQNLEKKKEGFSGRTILKEIKTWKNYGTD